MSSIQLWRSYFQEGMFQRIIDDLHEGSCYFRTINPLLDVCDCADYYKYKYCKHTLAIKIRNSELSDPVIETKKTRGRKGNISKALERKN